MTQTLTPLQQMVLDTIDEIQTTKREAKTAPDFATIIEIRNSFDVEMKEAINQLYRMGAIVWHKNVNGIPMFGIKR